MRQKYKDLVAKGKKARGIQNNNDDQHGEQHSLPPSDDLQTENTTSAPSGSSV